MSRNCSSRHSCHRKQQWRDQWWNVGTKQKYAADRKEHVRLFEDAHLQQCCFLKTKETGSVNFLSSNFTNTHDENPEAIYTSEETCSLRQLKDTGTVTRLKEVNPLWHPQKHWFTFCVAMSLKEMIALILFVFNTGNSRLEGLLPQINMDLSFSGRHTQKKKRKINEWGCARGFSMDELIQ